MTRLFLAILLFPIMAVGQENQTFRQYFMEFRSAAAQKDTNKLKELIYPFKDEEEDMRAELINMILHGNVSQKGDGAFSLRALDSLIGNHLDKIQKIDEKTYDILSHDPVFGKTIRSVGKKQIYTFEHKGARMILFKTKNKTQLFFWENLNKLL